MARQRAQAGSPLRISAGDYNDAVDAGQWFAQQQALGRGGSPLSVSVNPCVVRVRNDSGGDLTAGSVVEIGAATVTLQRTALRFTGDERSGYDPVFGVLLESIPDGKYGDCQLAGVCMADVDIQDEDNTHGRVVAGSTTLEGHTGGWARIIHKPSGTGVKKCAVMLGHQARPLRWARTTTNSDYPDYPDAGPTYVVEFGDCVASPSPVPGVSSSPSFTAFSSPAWKEIAVDPEGGSWDEGSIVRVERHDDGQWWIRPQGGGTPSTSYLAHIWGATSTSTGIYVDGSSTADTSPFDLSSSGSWYFPGLGGITFTSGVASITRTTPTTYSSTCYTLKQRAPYLVTVMTYWELPSLSLSNARSLFRGATHNHSYTDDGAGMTTGNTQPDVRALDDGGVVSVTTTMFTDYTSSALDYWMGNSTCRPFYSSDNASHYMTHTTNRMVDCRGRSYDTTVRFRVKRDDSVSYCTPRCDGIHVAIQQMGYEE